MWWWLAGLALTVFGGAVVYHYWDKIKQWFANVLRDFAKVIRKIGELRPNAQYATEVVAILLESGAVLIEHRSYVEQPNGSYEMTPTKATIQSKDDLPENIKNKLRRAGNVVRKEVDVEREMEMEVGI